ncbi:hypothetical protein [Trichormus azollae]|uniref:hypothetical protein n=1 Tax=Trichormus azollae TaxID=1164 RepID=UPI00325C9593
MWSTPLAIRQHNKSYYNCLQKQVNIVAVPELGTSISCVPINEVARQMSMACLSKLSFQSSPLPNFGPATNPGFSQTFLKNAEVKLS